ncbi:uncharacterized protein [Cherax quadricarinatus]|uniref:uncharacterized protein n=1 Tax=Cherax quadricarinatus TaxID=27406 RepID=UPI00387E88DB
MVTVGDNEYTIPVHNSFDALSSLENANPADDVASHVSDVDDFGDEVEQTFSDDNPPFCLRITSNATIGSIVQASVLNAPVHVFMDSGAQVNIIRSCLFKDKQLRHVLLVELTHVSSLSGIAGSRLRVRGQTALTFSIQDRDFTASFLAVGQITFPGDLLLGFVYMRDLRIVLDPYQWNAQIDDLTVPFWGYQFGSEIYHTAAEYEVRIKSLQACAFSSSVPKWSGTGNSVTPVYIPPTTSGMQDSVQLPQVSEEPPTTLSAEPIPAISASSSSSSSTGDALLENDYLQLVMPSFVDVTGHLQKDVSVAASALTRVSVVVCVPDGDNVLVDSDSCKVKGLFVEPSLHVVRDSKIHFFLANTSGHSAHLRANTSIVDLVHYPYPVQIEDELSPDQWVGAISTREASSIPLDQSILSVEEKDLAPTDFPDEVKHLLSLLNKHRKAIALPGEKMGITNLSSHHIPLEPGTRPIYIPACTMPHSQVAVTKELINQMLDEGVIAPSNSPWNAPLILVPKKDATWHPVIASGS